MIFLHSEETRLHTKALSIHARRISAYLSQWESLPVNFIGPSPVYGAFKYLINPAIDSLLRLYWSTESRNLQNNYYMCLKPILGSLDCMMMKEIETYHNPVRPYTVTGYKINYQGRKFIRYVFLQELEFWMHRL